MNSSTQITGQPLLLTVKQAAAKLGVAPGTIRSLMEAGRLTKIKLTNTVKGQVYVRAVELEALAATPALEHAFVEAARKRLAEINAERVTLGLKPVTDIPLLKTEARAANRPDCFAVRVPPGRTLKVRLKERYTMLKDTNTDTDNVARRRMSSPTETGLNGADPAGNGLTVPEPVKTPPEQVMVALKRRKKSPHEAWHDWSKVIGPFYWAGSQECQRKAKAKKREGKGYIMLFSTWLKANSADEDSPNGLGEKTRGALLKIMEHRETFDRWLVELERVMPEERAQLTHPIRMLSSPKVVPKGGASSRFWNRPLAG